MKISDFEQDARPEIEMVTTVASLAQSVSVWTTLRATIVKDLQIAVRYLPNLIGNFVQLGVRVLFFLLLSSVVSIDGEATVGRDLTQQDLFIFFQGALLLFVFITTSLWTPINAVNRDLYNGTLEYLYSNPISRYAYYAGTVMAEAIVGLVVFLPLYFILAFASETSWQNMLMVLVVSLTVLVALIAMGILISLLGLLWRQVNSLAEVLNISFELLAGAYFPVTAFPEIIQYVAYILPYTWGYDLIRYYSFGGDWQTLLPVEYEWAIVIGYAIFYTGLSIFLLGKVEARAKQKGLHLI